MFKDAISLEKYDLEDSPLTVNAKSNDRVSVCANLSRVYTCTVNVCEALV